MKKYNFVVKGDEPRGPTLMNIVIEAENDEEAQEELWLKYGRKGRVPECQDLPTISLGNPLKEVVNTPPVNVIPVTHPDSLAVTGELLYWYTPIPRKVWKPFPKEVRLPLEGIVRDPVKFWGKRAIRKNCYVRSALLVPEDIGTARGFSIKEKVA